MGGGPLAHTPLMAITNAISGIIIVEALLQLDVQNSLVQLLAGVSVLIATINIVGGFMVTRRMLQMFKKSWAEGLRMTIGLQTAAYLSATVLFILALGGLSNQEKAKRAVWYGIIGMAIAVVATMADSNGALVSC